METMDGWIRLDCPLDTPLDEVKARWIGKAVEACEGDTARAAVLLKIGVATVFRGLAALKAAARVSGRPARDDSHPAGAGGDASGPLPPGGRESLKGEG